LNYAAFIVNQKLVNTFCSPIFYSSQTVKIEITTLAISYTIAAHCLG